MATGCGFSGSLNLSSDQVFDRNCTACEEDNIICEAVCYCTVCYKYYCTRCQKSHNRLLKNHREKLLDKDAMLKSVQKPPASAALTSVCEEHDRVVEIYCADHNVVCCTVCVAIHHKKCEKTDFIPKIASGYSKNPNVAKIRSEIQSVRKDMMAVKSSRRCDQARIKKEREQVLAQVKDSRRRINAVLDRLEEVVVRGADTRYEEFDDTIQTDLKKCDEALSKIETTIQGLERPDTSNDAQLFVHVKQGEERIGAWKELGNHIKQHVGGDSIKFVLDEDIERYLRNIQKLGEFSDEIRKKSSKPRLVDRKENVLAKMKDDSNTCTIWGSCALPGGGALLSDTSNNQLKRLDSSYKVADSCSIQRPVGVCYIDQSEKAAVCVYEAVKIVSLGSTMSVLRSINMDNLDCYGVAYRNNLLYVTENGRNKLHVYEYSTGCHVAAVQTDRQSQKMFSSTVHVATNRDGSQIWVADVDKGLVVLDRDYNLLRVVKVDGVGGALGVCVGKQDSVFVCCEKPRAVLQLNSEGEKISTLLQREDLPQQPWSVCFDEHRSRLLVTMFDTDTIKVVHFK